MARQNISYKPLALFIGTTLGSVTYSLEKCPISCNYARADDSGVVAKPSQAPISNSANGGKDGGTPDAANDAGNTDSGRDGGKDGGTPDAANDAGNTDSGRDAEDGGWNGKVRLTGTYDIITNTTNPSNIKQAGFGTRLEAAVGYDFGNFNLGLLGSADYNRLQVIDSDVVKGTSQKLPPEARLGPALELRFGEENLETQVGASLQGLLTAIESQKKGTRDYTTHTKAIGGEAELVFIMNNALSGITKEIHENLEGGVELGGHAVVKIQKADSGCTEFGLLNDWSVYGLINGRVGRLTVGAGGEHIKRYDLGLPSGVYGNAGSLLNGGCVSTETTGYNGTAPIGKLEIDLGNSWKTSLLGIYGSWDKLKPKGVGVALEGETLNFGAGYKQTTAGNGHREGFREQEFYLYMGVTGDSSDLLRKGTEFVRKIVPRRTQNR